MKHDNNNQNPWAGLSSYEDPAKSEQNLKFCGRDNETKEVARLIDDNFFVTLYGKSGIGKTSLLNAGVFPALRREQYTPLSLRLGLMEETSSFQDVITQAIERAIEEIGGRVHIVNVMDEQTEQYVTDYLWRWFARRRFLTANGPITFPVLVFDQFEEVFRHKESRKKTKVLLEQLNYLIDESHAIGNCVVDGEEYSYDFNFRFVLSIREDDLYRLEDALDNCALSALKRCRYRLCSLSEQGAHDAILIPGEGLFKEEEKVQIAQTIIGIARNKEDQSISTNLLSLVCNRLYVDSQKTGSVSISQSLVDSFVKSNPFERFYNEATRGFSNKEKLYIEKHLVDSTGRRNSIPESDFLANVENGAKLIDGKNRILQRISTSSNGGNSRIELIHDSFCDPIILLKTKRLQRKRFSNIVLTGIMAILIFGIGSLIKSQNDHNWELMKMESRYIAAQAERLIDEGDSHMAQRLLLEVLPPNIEAPSRPYVSEAGSALWRAVSSDSYMLDKIHFGCFPIFSPFGSSVVTNDNYDCRINKWDITTGKILFSRQLSNIATNIEYSSDGKVILVSSYGNCSVLNANDGSILKEIPTVSNNCISLFSSDSKKIIIIEDSIIYIRNTSDFLLGNVYKQSSRICFVKNIELGNRLLFVSEDGKLKIVSLNDMVLQKTFKITGSPITFQSKGKFIATQDNEYIRIYDIIAGKQICIIKGWGDNFSIFSEDGKYFYYQIDDMSERKRAVWNLDTNSLQSTYSVDGYSDSFALSPDGKILASISEGGIEVRNIPAGTGIGFYKEEHCCFVNISPDGKTIISQSTDGIIKIWDLNKRLNARVEHKMPKETSPFFVLSPNGELLVTHKDNLISMWNFKSKKLIHTLKGHVGDICSISFNSDGHRLVTSSLDGVIMVWNTYNGQCLHTLKRNGKIKIWNSKTKKATTVFNNFSARIVDAVFCENGKGILSFSADGVVTKWNLETEKILRETEYANIANGFLAINKDGYVISLSDHQNLDIWDSQTGKRICSLEGGFFNPLNATFSENGNLVAVLSGEKNKIKIWNILTGESVIDIDGADADNYIQFVKNDTQLFYRTKNGGISYKNIPNIQNIIDKTHALFYDRRLNDKEKRMYYIK